MINTLRKAAVKLKYVERGMVVAITMLMIGLYGFNVLVREVTPQYASIFAWIDEAARILMVWGVFVTLGLALERGRHIAMSTLLDAMSEKFNFYTRKLIDLIGLTFSIYSSWLGYQISVFVANTGQVSPTLNMPMYILYVGPMVGFMLLALRYGMDLFGLTDRYGPDNDASLEQTTAG